MNKYHELTKKIWYSEKDDEKPIFIGNPDLLDKVIREWLEEKSFELRSKGITRQVEDVSKILGLTKEPVKCSECGRWYRAEAVLEKRKN